MATQFRELIRPGSNYEFVGKSRFFISLSIIAVLLSLAMLPINSLIRGSMLNWTIDFKGGTEMIIAFEKPVTGGEIRSALHDIGRTNADVSSLTFSQGGESRQGYLVRLAEFGAVSKAEVDRVDSEIQNRFADRSVLKANWSGDTLFIRTGKPVTQEEIGELLKSQGLEMKPWTDEQAKELAKPLQGTSEYNYQIAVYGLDRMVERGLAAKLGTAVDIKQVDAVGAKAGKELRNDAIMSMLYAIALIMLYIAFRFDFRYGPGTVAALVHDAVVVIGVFAITWTEFSLTTVAAVLTVIGYSMNDTVVVFDRIRENESRLKDKKLDRVINISINETLSRTILTALTTFVTTLAMNLLGTGLVKNFAFAMNVGIIVGTYSSIFIAAPILLWLHEHFFSKRPATNPRRLSEAGTT
ncbi:MAG: protein translocase subunit SecF [Pseudomonadota bacterium]